MCEKCISRIKFVTFLRCRLKPTIMYWACHHVKLVINANARCRFCMSFTLYSTPAIQNKCVVNCLNFLLVFIVLQYIRWCQKWSRLIGGNLLPMLMPSNMTLCQISIFYGCFKCQWKFKAGSQHGVPLCVST